MYTKSHTTFSLILNVSSITLVKIWKIFVSKFSIDSMNNFSTSYSVYFPTGLLSLLDYCFNNRPMYFFYTAIRDSFIVVSETKEKTT